MSKRKAFDETTTEELTKNLKASTGAGMDAFFSIQPKVQSPTPLANQTTVEVEGKPNEVVIISKLNRKTTERSIERSNDRSNERTKTRHSFDVYQDQLDALEEIQHKTTKAGKKKPSLGCLAQEAFDDYIAKVNGKTTEKLEKS